MSESMLATVPALAIGVLALLPGALYSWGFEQAAGQAHSRAADRTLRFVGGSAVFHAAVAPLTWWVATRQVHDSVLTGARFWWPLWPGAIALVALPTATGRMVGRGFRERRPWAVWWAGATAAPDAWHHVFVEGRHAWVRVRLRGVDGVEGGWVVGQLGHPADGPSGFVGDGPDPDLYLSDTAEVDPASGQARCSADGLPVMRGTGVLVRRADILLLEVSWQ